MQVTKLKRMIAALTFTGGVFACSSVMALQVSYTYDKLNRLTSATFGTQTVAYHYDSNGNIEEAITPEGCTTIVYRDADGDTYGNPEFSLQTCDQADGFVANNTDCNDNDFLEHPNQTWYPDIDNDGYYSGLLNTTSCIRPTGHKTAAELVTVTITDNAPFDPNPKQEDADNDGIGDLVDPFPNNPSYSLDSDGDGLADEWELATFQDLTTAGVNSDYDNDTLTDLQEFIIGSDARISINERWDVNGDGVIGLEEAINALRVMSGEI